MSRWFRVYDDMVDDPKVQRLGPDLFKALVNLWCLASKNNGLIPCVADIAFKLRLKSERVLKILAELSACGLIDETEGHLVPHNWNNRQYKSDVSNERVKRYRERQSNGDCNVTEAVTVTPPETDTEQIQSRAEKKGRSQGSRLADDWLPSADDLNYGATLGLTAQQVLGAAEDMRLWAKANSNRSIGRKADWSSTFKGWMRRNKQEKPNGKPTVTEAIRTHIEQGISFGPKPQLIPSPAGCGAFRLLPEGRCERPRDVHGGNRSDPVRILDGSDPACDGPENGTASKDHLPPDRARG